MVTFDPRRRRPCALLTDGGALQTQSFFRESALSDPLRLSFSVKIDKREKYRALSRPPGYTELRRKMVCNLGERTLSIKAVGFKPRKMEPAGYT